MTNKREKFQVKSVVEERRGAWLVEIDGGTSWLTARVYEEPDGSMWVRPTAGWDMRSYDRLREAEERKVKQAVRRAKNVGGKLQHNADARTPQFVIRAPFLMPAGRGVQQWRWFTWYTDEGNKHAAVLKKAKELDAARWSYDQAEMEDATTSPLTRYARNAHRGVVAQKTFAPNAREFWVWALRKNGVEPLASEGPWGPYDLTTAKYFARIGAQEGSHDRVVTHGSDPRSIVPMRRYRAGTGKAV